MWGNFPVTGPALAEAEWVIAVRVQGYTWRGRVGWGKGGLHDP